MFRKRRVDESPVIAKKQQDGTDEKEEDSGVLDDDDDNDETTKFLNKDQLLSSKQQQQQQQQENTTSWEEQDTAAAASHEINSTRKRISSSISPPPPRSNNKNDTTSSFNPYSTTSSTCSCSKAPPHRFLIILVVQMILIFFYVGHVFYSIHHQEQQQQQQRHDHQVRMHPKESKQQEIGSSTTSVDSNTAQHRLNDPNDVSWLDHIQLGEWIGSGGWSDVFDAIILDKEQCKNPPPCNNNNKNKSYIIKFTGDIATDGDVDHAKSSITAVEVVKRLSPHPSIPENLYFVPKIPNPFPNRFQLPNVTRPVKSTTGAEQMNRKRLLTSKYMSIQVSEKVTQTHNHMHGYMPGDKLRCFLYRFFQVLDYAHSKNIMMIDLVLYNVILQDGVMKFIDWSDAMFFETEKERSIRIKQNITYPYAFCSAGICSDGKHLQFDHVHEYDVKKLAYRISRLLKYYDVMDMEYDGYKRENDDEYYFISTRDRKLIQDLLDKMSNEKPAPTLGWLLENHDYFTMEDSSNCTLLW